LRAAAVRVVQEILAQAQVQQAGQMERQVEQQMV
jgi:hypothetical protein